MRNNSTNQITDINTLQFIHTLRNFTHIISMQSNAVAVTLSTYSSGRIRRGRYPAASRFQMDLKNLNPVHP